MSHIAFANIREGIALSIIQLLEHFGVDQKGFIDVVLTKAELGQMAATTTSAAIKLSNEFQKDGIIIIEEKKIKIVDMKRLYKSAGIHYKASSFEEGKLYWQFFSFN